MGEIARRRLLILDDEGEIRETLSQFFRGVGYAVDTAADATVALERLPQGFDVILSDIKMPGMNGIEFLQQARRINPRVGIFLITGYPTLETVIDAKQFGAVAYFRKPLKLMEVDSRIRAFLGEDAQFLIDGRVLVVGGALMERLADRLARFQTVVAPGEEAAFLQAVGENRPRAVLADAASPATPGLLQAYQRLRRDANSFILVSDGSAFDRVNEMLFALGAADCIMVDAPQEQFERRVKEAVDRREAEKLDQQGRVEELANKCMFAKAYRNGYYCLKQGSCPYGPFQGGWIAIDGKEHQKCVKRPLLVDSLEGVGFATWTGRLEASRAPEMRKQLLALVREGKRELVIDAQGLQAANYNLFEILSDVYAELAKVHPDGAVHVINLAEPVLQEFRKATINKGVRCYGVRMVDERSTFERWGTRFD
jgi:DNA-binding response OmpR family regulator